MITYFSDIYNYNEYRKKFTRFGKQEWHVIATPKGICINGRYMRFFPDEEYSYRLRSDGIYSCLTPKEFIRHFFEGWACQGFGERYADLICMHVYQHGMEISLFEEQEELFLAKCDGKSFVCKDRLAFDLLYDWMDEYLGKGYKFIGDNLSKGLIKMDVTYRYEKDNKKFNLRIKKL